MGRKKELHTFLKGQNSVKARLGLDFLEDDVKMETTEFLADIMLHLNDVNFKLQGKSHSVFNFISTVCAFQKKWNRLLLIWSQLLHFLKLLEQRKGYTDIKYVRFIEKLIDNFKKSFDDFVLREQLLLFFFVLFIFILHLRESELHRYILDGKSALARELPFP